ncbi:MAG: 16S rRNA (cytidine(1402)-2'-O)-methyltransferase [Ignavibacterium album]|jgi:16S rRNA (cytidine1402-2'-O)-methyltransferase|uniref:16S rRNA (cytidine(1402)-2'-O)-methyltransferase n=1 Tax=Ignavibacterium album TaxID=591197 RepID=UPI0026F0A664|nr:16S rRNA (cytidine(1402)-2'-O)-methyltransferase [Ignavibacterium album]MCX8106536.1 16S rRNA (cytidine(1402)-2'-O)-methyltransferase [Ignavibacterium album]
MKLFIVSTPIGNLKDITLRAIETLKEVDFIICEDTRVTGNLLKHFEISKELVSLNAFNESQKLFQIIDKIKTAESVALVSDSGTPTISDPGIRLISEALKHNIEIIPVPGPSAVIAALSVSGLPTESFVFEGFLPQKKGRQKKLKQLSEEERTIVLYESVYRIEKLLDELVEFMPERFVVVCRELTKKFEECWRGFPAEIKTSLTNKTVKGEFVIAIAPKNWRV